MARVSALLVTILLALGVLPTRAVALERFCDTAFENCRDPLIQLIRNEQTAIDVAFWFMEDARYSAELASAKQRGVQIRVIFDSDELLDDPHGVRAFVLNQLESAGIPMREKVNSGINHWKLMLFVSQGTLQFSGANHTDEAFVPVVDYVNYVDEVIYFTDRPEIIKSFKAMFDRVWTDTSGMMANYANVGVLSRIHDDPVTGQPYPVDPEMNFAPFQSFRSRSVQAYNAETQAVDAIIYRITDRAHTDALINAIQRGVRLRLLTEPHQYRDESRLWHAWNVDRLYMAGVQHPIGGAPGAEIRHRGHQGLLHEKLTLLTGQQMAVFGSSNWTSASSDSQLEHNLFTKDPAFYASARAHFDRKWFNLGPSPESTTFQPLPPDTPQLRQPSNGAGAQPLSVTLRWSAGPWAHRYDLLFGTDPANLAKVVDDMELGPYDKTFTAKGLAAGTTYYWRVVSRTMANLTRTSTTWSFTTQAPPTQNVPPSVTLTAPVAGASYNAPASITMTASASDSDGTVARVDFLAGSTLVGSALSAPFTATWSNVPAGNYSLTARATDNAGATTTSSASAVTVSTSSTPLPSPWNRQDVGATGRAGGANVNGGIWTVTGSGADVWGTADAFHFVYQPLAGDGSIVAKVRTIQNVNVWTKAGVMIREQLGAGSKHAFLFATPSTSKGVNFQRRAQTGGTSSHTGGPARVAPVWLRLTRAGSTITADYSIDGVSWVLVGTDTIAMTSTVQVGLAVSSHVTSTLATATFDSVTVNHSGGPPPPNVPPAVSLSSPGAGATFAAPASIPLAATASDSDGTIARVEFRAASTIVGTDTTSPYSFTWNNVPAGTYSVTARAIDNAGAATVSSAVSVTVTGGGSTVPAPWTTDDIGAVGAAGSGALAGTTWTVNGAGSDVWGTADALHFVHQPLAGNGSIVARVQMVEHIDQWTKAGVMIRESLTAGSKHAFMIVTPSTVKGLAFQRRPTTGGPSAHTGGGALTAPVWVRLTRSGSTITAERSMDGSTWTVVGTDTIAMSQTVHIGLAVSSHVSGTLATARFDNVTVSQGGTAPPPNTPPSVTLTSPAAGATFPEPASISISASASDADGSVARVEFYAGSTHLGTDMTSPYSLTWSNVSAGSYTLTARAVDNAGAARVSSGVGIQVTAGSGTGALPTGWTSADIGAVGAAGGAELLNGAYHLTGSGADIWGTADAFHFAYRTLTGDGAIEARVDALSFTDVWTKAGVMIRGGTTSSSAHAMMVVSPGKGLAFQRRTVNGGVSTHTGVSGSMPAWVRLERMGSTITASVSQDGQTWTIVGSDSIALPPTVLVGLPLTSHRDGALAQATISQVTVTP